MRKGGGRAINEETITGSKEESRVYKLQWWIPHWCGRKLVNLIIHYNGDKDKNGLQICCGNIIDKILTPWTKEVKKAKK